MPSARKQIGPTVQFPGPTQDKRCHEKDTKYTNLSKKFILHKYSMQQQQL